MPKPKKPQRIVDITPEQAAQFDEAGRSNPFLDSLAEIKRIHDACHHRKLAVDLDTGTTTCRTCGRQIDV